MASGARPTLIRTQRWTTGPHAAALRASIAAHDPQAEQTISQAHFMAGPEAADELLEGAS